MLSCDCRDSNCSVHLGTESCLNDGLVFMVPIGHQEDDEMLYCFHCATEERDNGRFEVKQFPIDDEVDWRVRLADEVRRGLKLTPPAGFITRPGSPRR